MIRLITIMLFLSVSLSAPAAADYTATLSPDDPLIKESPKKSNHSETANAAEQNDRSARENQEIALSYLRDISAQLTAISRNLAPDKVKDAAKENNESEALRAVQADLIQQTRMARGTIAMAAIAFAALVLCGWVICLLYKNLREARNATKAAEKAASVARAQLMQNRAYMVLDPASLSFTWIQCDKVIFNCRWINYGESPAVDVTVSYKFHLVKNGVVPNNFYDQRKEADNKLRVTVPPGRHFQGHMPPPLPAIVLLPDDPTDLIVYIECSYSDVHGRRFKNAFDAHILAIGGSPHTKVAVRFILSNTGETEII